MAFMADEETGAVMLKIVRRATAGWLFEENDQEFRPVSANNRLSVGKAAQERFGFTAEPYVGKCVRTTISLKDSSGGGCERD